MDRMTYLWNRDKEEQVATAHMDDPEPWVNKVDLTLAEDRKKNSDKRFSLTPDQARAGHETLQVAVEYRDNMIGREIGRPLGPRRIEDWMARRPGNSEQTLRIEQAKPDGGNPQATQQPSHRTQDTSEKRKAAPAGGSKRAKLDKDLLHVQLETLKERNLRLEEERDAARQLTKDTKTLLMQKGKQRVDELKKELEDKDRTIAQLQEEISRLKDGAGDGQPEPKQ
ncbi:Chromosome partition protein Smc [Carpediemonas membranifera]|uniref:Chromosome partition protein Smc n=1 Tax=Carpediemonas membranifera TaxID=201153 RepID=A0A8J6B0A9_9EUKA|nr:Chromosome partition protein Smc [Carpediemonas membranifera]|eukprot:KAG9392763.1 Chromosome partition protein Smc [Carpediemonas membranifera]